MDESLEATTPSLDFDPNATFSSDSFFLGLWLTGSIFVLLENSVTYDRRFPVLPKPPLPLSLLGYLEEEPG